jgi:branched-subunit amino acid transport protein AzlD
METTMRSQKNINLLFRRTAIALLVLLAAETAWALTILPAFGVPSLVALGIAVVLFWWPRRRTSS